MKNFIWYIFIMKKNKLQNISRLREIFQNPWYYLWFLLFSLLLISFYYTINYSILWIFLFFTGIIVFGGLKELKSWGWKVCFFVLPTQIFFVSLHILSFIDDLSCWAPYLCSWDSADEALYNFRNKNPYVLILLIFIVIIFFFVFVILYRKREKYNVKNIFYNTMFWLFNISYIVFMIYWLIEVFTTEYNLAG